MKLLELTQNKFAMVDDDRFEELNKFKWYTSKGRNTFYARRTVNKRKDKLHHYIIGFPLPGYVVDHINNNGLDCRLENLRIITTRQNITNSINRSHFPGVEKTGNKWRVKIHLYGTTVRIGSFKSQYEAIVVYRNTIRVTGQELLPEHENIYLEFHKQQVK
jgi:hypothetical protein